MYPIQFGACIPIFAMPGGQFFRTPNYKRLDPAVTMKYGRLADALGYDSLWVADHLMLGQDEAILEGWTTLAALAGSTQRAKLGIIHQAHFFRHPSVSAKAIATLDQISGGRFIYFIDTGTRASEHHAYGLNYPDTMEDRMADLIEGLELELKLWASTPEHPLTFDGQFYSVKDAVCTPHPVSQPHPPIWFGEAHPLIMQACARYGQGWNSVPVGQAELLVRVAALDAACREIGRDPAEVERTLEIQILIAQDHDGLRAALRTMIALTPDAAVQIDAGLQSFIDGTSDTIPESVSDSWIIGTPDEVKQQVEQRIALGFSHFMLWFMDAPESDGLRLFIEQVAPHFRV